MKTIGDILTADAQERATRNAATYRGQGLPPGEALTLALFEELVALVTRTEIAQEGLMQEMERRIAALEKA